MQLTLIGSSMTKRNKSCESEVMLTMQRKELLKKSAIRYAEYYGMVEVQDALLVDAACRIDTLCNLIDVDPDFLYLRCHGFYVAMVCLNDIPVNGNLAKIRRHVLGRDELHFLFNQCPFFL